MQQDVMLAFNSHGPKQAVAVFRGDIDDAYDEGIFEYIQHADLFMQIREYSDARGRLLPLPPLSAGCELRWSEAQGMFQYRWRRPSPCECACE
mmetsp:Transcript_46904/g.68880  ORF Transcript_46904/g.68880 Transcript_46904/m.68880 type:complete len:93 (+) Transcript_46904:590-868(+)